MNSENCTSIKAKKTCSLSFTFDSSGLSNGSRTGSAVIRFSNYDSYEFFLRANITESFQTPMGDKEAEEYFNARIPEGDQKLTTFLKTNQITSEEFNAAIADLSTYRDQTFNYTRDYYRHCQGPYDEGFLVLSDSVYAERLRYLGKRLKAMIADPSADFANITPEVSDYVPAKKGCKGDAETILKCTQGNIAKRAAAIYKSIVINNPNNQAPYKACMDVGRLMAKTYSRLVGTFHHKKAALRNQEIADVEDKVLGLVQQDLTEGY